MHRTSLIRIAALAVAFPVSGLFAEEAATPVVSLDAPRSYTAEEVFTAYGWLVAKQIGVSELGFTEEEVAALAKGLQLARSGGEAPIPQEELQGALSGVLEPRLQAFRAAEEAKQAEVAKGGHAEQEKYFAELDAAGKVTKTASGLRYEVIAAGEGAKPGPTALVKVHYTGTLTNGTVFDSSVTRGEPAEFRLNQVIPGWTEGLQLVGKGGKLKLHIPSDLAYGDAGRPSIPPASALVFDVELIDILDAGEQPATN